MDREAGNEPTRQEAGNKRPGPWQVVHWWMMWQAHIWLKKWVVEIFECAEQT